MVSAMMKPITYIVTLMVGTVAMHVSSKLFARVSIIVWLKSLMQIATHDLHLYFAKSYFGFNKSESTNLSINF